MGVIYCNSCSKGIHYTDICRGGENGVPALKGKKLKAAIIFEAVMDVMLFGSFALAFVCIFWMLVMIGP